MVISTKSVKPELCIVVHQDTNVQAIERYLRERSFSGWIYLGRNYKSLLSWEHRLNYFCSRILIGDLIKNTAWKIRKPYIDWVEKIGRPYGNALEWWLSLVNYNNTLVSPLFLSLCYFYICKELLEKTRKNSLLLIVDDWGLLETLKRFLNKNNYNNIIIPSKGFLRAASLIKKAIWFIGSWGLLIANIIKYKYAGWASLRECSKSTDNGENNLKAIIHTCVDEKCFGENGKFNDRYFPSLAEWLERCGYDVYILPFLYQIERSVKSAYIWFRKSKSNFLISEDYLSVKDYLSSSKVIFKQLFIPKGRVFFYGHDISPLINELKWMQAKNTDHMRFLTYIPMLRNLSQNKFRIDLFIDKFENMPKEKPQINALRDYYPECKIVGYQHASLPPFMLKYTTTPQEFFRGPFPDIVLSNGPWFKERLLTDGIPEEHLRIGPSLRSGYLFSREKKFQPTIHDIADDLIKYALIILSIETNMTLELLEKVIRAFENDSIRILLKPHPMSDHERLLKLTRRNKLPRNMGWIRGSMIECLKKANLVVAIGSAAIMEAAAHGVPIIVVGRECGLDMNPLGWWEKDFDVLKPVFDPIELRSKAKMILKEQSNGDMKRWAQLRQKILQCYEPVTDNSLSQFLP